MARAQDGRMSSLDDADTGSVARRAAAIALAWGLVWLGLILLAYLAWQLRVILSLAFVAVLLAAALRRPVELSQRLGAPRVLGVVLTYLALLVVVGLGVWLIVPPLVEQASALVGALPEIVERSLAWLRSTLAPIVPGDALDQAIGEIQSRLGGALPDVQAVLEVPLVVVGVLFNVVLVVFLSAFLVLDGGSLFKTVLEYVAPERRERLSAVGSTVIGKLGAYVSGQLVIMSVTGIGAAIGMLILGVPFVLPLGFLAFLTEAIPIAGPFLSGIPIVLIAFLEGPLQGLLMVGWIILLQQLEGWVLIPIVQNRAVQVSPTVVLLAVVAGGAIAGVLGALIAIPAVAAMQVAMREVVLPMRRRSWQAS